MCNWNNLEATHGVLAHYWNELPVLMSFDHEKLKEILAEAAALATPDGRASYLDGVCGDDPELRAEVESLLTAHEDAGEFLTHPVLPPAEEPNGEGAGTVVGRYKLLEEIGEGTFGGQRNRPVPSAIRWLRESGSCSGFS